MKLKSKFFYQACEVAEFVNERSIKKENIQSITVYTVANSEGCYALFWWE